jgi:hypothetical protein
MRVNLLTWVLAEQLNFEHLPFASTARELSLEDQELIALRRPPMLSPDISETDPRGERHLGALELDVISAVPPLVFTKDLKLRDTARLWVKLEP